MLVGVALGGALLDGVVLEGAVLEGAVLEGVVVTAGVLGVWHAATEVMTAAPINATAKARVDIGLSIAALSVPAASFQCPTSTGFLGDRDGWTWELPECLVASSRKRYDLRHVRARPGRLYRGGGPRHRRTGPGSSG
jgi:hypothetical protein